MAPAWDSDSESEVTLPPLNFNFKDPEIYKHLKKHRVLDAVERERVDSDTVIASLYDYSDGEVDNQLVRSLARSGEVEVPCQIELSNGQFYPPTTTDGQHGCYFFVGYNKLVRSHNLMSVNEADIVLVLCSGHSPGLQICERQTERE